MAIVAAPHHTFITLTKHPTRYGDFDIPDNLWIGITAETGEIARSRVPSLLKASARVRFASIEPIQSTIDTEDIRGIDWMIVGCQTGIKSPPINISMVDSAIKAARTLGIATFEKPNTGRPGPREFPVTVHF